MSNTGDASDYLFQQLRKKRQFLSTVGVTLQFFAWLQMVGAIIVGIALIAYTREIDGRFFSETERPYVGLGIGAALGGVAVGVWMLTVGSLAAYLSSRDALADANLEKPPTGRRSPGPTGVQGLPTN